MLQMYVFPNSRTNLIGKRDSENLLVGQVSCQLNLFLIFAKWSDKPDRPSDGIFIVHILKFITYFRYEATNYEKGEKALILQQQINY